MIDKITAFKKVIWIKFLMKNFGNIINKIISIKYFAEKNQ